MPADSRKSEAIVIRQTDFSESSRVVTFYTRDFGKVSALAKGAKRLKGAFEAAIDLLNQCQIVFLHKSSTNLDILTEAKLLSRFRATARDVHHYYAALYVAELLESLSEPMDPHPHWYDAAAETLRLLETTADFRITILRFQMRTLDELGLLPDFTQCQCGRLVEDNDQGWSMWIQQGVLLCSECRQIEASTRPLTGRVLIALRLLQTSTVSLAEDQTPSSETLRIIQHLLTALISQILDRRPRMLAYLKF